MPKGLRTTAQTATTITIGWTQVADLTYEVSNNNGTETDYAQCGSNQYAHFHWAKPRD